MPQATGDLKRRIKGIQNTKKITKAMELVAASKMRRAVNAALATRPYALQARALLHRLSTVTHEELHPLLQQRDVKKALVVVFSSDRGLAGGLTSNLVRAVSAARQQLPADTDFIVFGKKAQDTLRRQGLTLHAVFGMPTGFAKFSDVLPAARIVLQAFRTGEYDRVDVVWTDYKSALLQRSMSRQILPISEAALEEALAEHIADAPKLNGATTEMVFEPSADVVLEAMLPRMVEVQLYQALLEASASEHAARMVAMRSATDAATDLIDDLTLTYNQARQAAITKDLSEISASRAALQDA